MISQDLKIGGNVHVYKKRLIKYASFASGIYPVPSSLIVLVGNS